jgi:hypothetical protein
MLLGLAVPTRAVAQSAMSRSEALGLLLLLGLSPRPAAAPAPAAKDLSATRAKKPRVAEPVTVNPSLRKNPPRAKAD